MLPICELRTLILNQPGLVLEFGIRSSVVSFPWPYSVRPWEWDHRTV